jgi:3-phosphoshikimate 1-carboxyvinyltransferase
MKERPIKELVDALHLIGAEINYLNKAGYPPIQITGKKLNATTIHIDASVSSQFISSLLLIAPTFENGCKIVLKGDVVSPGYINMTIELMREFGIKVEWVKDTIQIEKGSYKAPRSNIFNESDWSAAGYFYNTLLFSDLKEIRLSGLMQNSIQPDSVTAKLFTPFGIDTIFEKDAIVLKKHSKSISFFEYDFTDCPDIAQTLAVTCVGTGIKVKLTGLRTLKIKETDRIIALKNELEKFGAEIIITEDSLEITDINKTNLNETIAVKTYNDHRMAMSFASLQFIYPNLQIEDHQVVSKSFPHFWDELKKMEL